MQATAPGVPSEGSYRLVTRVASAGAALAALLTLVGWELDLELLRAVVRGLQPMMPLTAVALAVSAGALQLAASTRRPVRFAAGVLGAAVAAFGAAVLLEYLFGLELPFDRALFPTRILTQEQHGRPAFFTAAVFVAFGAAILLLARDDRRSWAAAQLLALLSLFPPIVGVAAYAYGGEPHFGIPGLLPYTAMALNTAVALLLLGIGALAARPRAGLMAIVSSDALGGTFARRLLSAAGLVPVLGVAVVVAERHGIVRPIIGSALLVSIGGFAAVTLVLFTARTLNQVDLDRRRLIGELAQWKHFFDHAAWGAVIGGVDGTLVRVNPAFARMHGYEVAELEGRPIAEMFSETARARLPDELRLVHEKGHHAYESEHVRKDGTTFPVFVDATAVRDDAGNVLYRAVYVQDLSEARRAEETRAQLAALVDSTDDAVISVDLEGTIRSWNRAAERMYGWTAEEVVGTQDLIARVAPPEVREQGREYIRRLRAGERVPPFEAPRLRKDGARFWASVTTSAIRDRAGRLVGVSSIVRDVSARKAAEDGLLQARATEARLRQRIEALGEAGEAVTDALARLPEIGLDAVLREIVVQARRLTGAEYAALAMGGGPNKPFEPFISDGMPPDTLDKVGHAPRAVGTLLAMAQAKGVTRVDDVRKEKEFRGLPPGHPPMGPILGMPLRYRGTSLGTLFLARPPDAKPLTADDEAGVATLGGRAAVAMEIARLYESEARERSFLRAVLEQLPDGVLLLDRDGKISLQNGAMLRLTGVDAARMMREWPPPFDLRRPTGQRLALRELPHVRALLEGLPTVAEELAVVKPDGSSVPVLANAAPIRDQGGRRIGAVAVVQDITALKELARLREEWSSVVAHDLRQPVGTINMAARLLPRLKQSGAVEREAWAIDSIVRASERLNRMIDDLLDVSRIEAGRLEVNLQPVDLRQALAEAVARAELLFPDRPITLAEIGEPAPVSADRDRIEQVLGNLLSNAVKYGRKGTPVPVVLTWREDEVEVAVTNEGPGIKPEDLARLFQRFVRTPEAKESGVAGIGLGLFISRGLVEAHGGRMWAESDPGRKTTFFFSLPVRRYGGHDAHEAGGASVAP